MATNLATGMAAPATPTQPDQSDPWAWNKWAQTQDPNLYGWKSDGKLADQIGSGDQMNGSALAGQKDNLQKAGLWNNSWDAPLASWQQGMSSRDAMASQGPDNPFDGSGLDFSSLNGLDYQHARSSGYNNIGRWVDANGNQVGNGNTWAQTNSMHAGDYADMLKGAAGVGAVVAGGYGLSGLLGNTAALAGGIGTTAAEGTPWLMAGDLGYTAPGLASTAGAGAGAEVASGAVTSPVSTGGAMTSTALDAGTAGATGATGSLGAIPASTAAEGTALGATPMATAPELGALPTASAVPGAAPSLTSGLASAGTAAESGLGNEASRNLAGINSTNAPMDPSAIQVPSTNSFGNDISNFAKQNPQLTTGLATGALTAMTGTGSNPPSGPAGTNPNVGASTNATNQQTIDALSKQINQNVGTAPNVPALQTTAGDPQQYYQQAADAMYDKQKQYLDPQVALKQKALESRLSEQGFVPGTPGYNQAMQTFQDTNNRDYAAARDSAIGQGVTAGQNLYQNNNSNAQLNNQASNSALNQYVIKQNQPVNTLNALQTGQQIQYNNGIDQYNAKTASQNSTNQTIGQLATAAGMYFSDARLKSDITPFGRTPGGANLYSYSIFGRKEIGVLAQELMQTQPDAVGVDPESGFYIVDYSKVR